jgi:hypothetical protein
MEEVPTVLPQNRPMAEQSSSDDRATLRLEPGIPGENTLTVRISPACAAEFVDLLDSHDLSHSEVFEASYSDGLSSRRSGTRRRCGFFRQSHCYVPQQA